MTPAFDLEPFSLPLARPLETAAGRITEREGIAVRVTNGTVGVGEATPLPGWTESLAACRSRLAARSTAPEMDYGGLDGYPAARHALQLAALDAQARDQGESLATLLATDTPARRIPIAAVLGADEASATAARDARMAGYPAVKVKVGGGPIPDAFDRLQAVRDAIGPELELRLDANQAWSIEEARRAFHAFAQIDVSFIEEPIREPTPDRLSQLPTGEVGIAVDESVAAPDFRLVDWTSVVNAVVIKPMAVGGVDRSYQLGTRAREAGLDVVISTTIDAVIARTAAVHLAAGLAVDTPAGLDTANRLATDLAPDPIEHRDGHLALPDSAGLGTLGPWTPEAGGEDGVD